MEKGDWNLDFEKIRERKLEEEELNRMIGAAERASQMLFDLRGDSQTLESAIRHLQALYELQEVREEKRKRAKRAEGFGRMVTLQTLYDEYQHWDRVDPEKRKREGSAARKRLRR